MRLFLPSVCLLSASRGGEALSFFSRGAQQARAADDVDDLILSQIGTGGDSGTISTSEISDASIEQSENPWLAQDNIEAPKYKRYGWYTKGGKKAVYASLPDSVNAIKGSLKNACIDEFIGFEAFDRESVMDAMKGIGYDVCVAPKIEIDTVKYKIETQLTCPKKGMPGIVRLDCKFVPVGEDPEPHAFYASRLGVRGGKGGSLLRSLAGNNNFLNRIQCDEKEETAKQLKECGMLLSTWVKMEYAFAEIEAKKNEARAVESAPPAPVTGTKSKSILGKDEPDNMETIFFIVGGGIVVLGIGIAVYSSMSGSNKKKKERSQPSHSSHIDNDNPDEEPAKSSRKPRKHKRKEDNE